VRELGSFDLVISNPPYIPAADVPTLQPEVRDHEPVEALTDGGDGYRFYRRFAELVPRLLRDESSFFLEIGYGQAGRLRDLFERSGLTVSILTDLDRIERILWAEKK
ncbi:MAG: protein-(glutamine-N5) methyltransferase, release factor-specific, partial [Bacteroidota bacterium]